MSHPADTKRCSPENGARSATFRVYECPVDGRACEVLEPLRAELAKSGEVSSEDYAWLVGALAENLPCRDCRRGEREARDLVGGSVRLGRHERRILLKAPPTSKCGWRDNKPEPTYPADGKAIYPEADGRSAEEAHRRALRKLRRLGLVETSMGHTLWTDEMPPEWVNRNQLRSRYWLWGRPRTMTRLTPLGERMVEAYRTELESGRPIRWQRHGERLVHGVHRPVAELLELLRRGGVERELFFKRGVSAYLARLDPQKAARRKREVEVLDKARKVLLAHTGTPDVSAGREEA
jgi:hypothetical protein